MMFVKGITFCGLCKRSCSQSKFWMCLSCDMAICYDCRGDWDFSCSTECHDAYTVKLALQRASLEEEFGRG